MRDLAILIPVLRRPQNVKPLVDSIRSTTKIDYEILFIVSPEDIEEMTAITIAECDYLKMFDNYENRGDYARKINEGYLYIEAEWYFTGADDLRFHPHWFEHAMRIGTCAIGTNDLGNARVKSGQHSTHSLVNKQYVMEQGTIDEKNKILHEGYTHCFCDDELVETAKSRGCWGFAMDSIVEHLHPFWKKATMDSTYESAQRNMDQDRALFHWRRHLWMR